MEDLCCWQQHLGCVSFIQKMFSFKGQWSLDGICNTGDNNLYNKAKTQAMVKTTE